MVSAVPVVSMVIPPMFTYQEALLSLESDLEDQDVTLPVEKEEWQLRPVERGILEALRRNPVRPFSVFNYDTPNRRDPMVLRVMMFLVQEQGLIAVSQKRPNDTVEIVVY